MLFSRSRANNGHIIASVLAPMMIVNLERKQDSSDFSWVMKKATAVALEQKHCRGYKTNKDRQRILESELEK